MGVVAVVVLNGKLSAELGDENAKLRAQVIKVTTRGAFFRVSSAFL
jgi:hypothetical protein